MYYNTGLLGIQMASRLTQFLKHNEHSKDSAEWAPYAMYGKKDEKKLVLEELETMLNDNLPVVISYHTGDENNQLTTFISFQILWGFINS